MNFVSEWFVLVPIEIKEMETGRSLLRNQQALRIMEEQRGDVI